MDITERLNKVVNILGINQTTFAKAVGISPGNISGIMTGKVKPSADALTKMCNIYKINISWLLTGDGEVFVKEGEDKISIKGLLPVFESLVDLLNERDRKYLLDMIENIKKI